MDQMPANEILGCTPSQRLLLRQRLAGWLGWYDVVGAPVTDQGIGR